jgi:single-strand DNA-binding protein
MLNKVTLIGNLGSDPDYRVLQSGAKVVRIRLATNENYKDREGNWQTKTEWHTVNAWGYLADYAHNNLKKGSLAFVEGKITTREWQDKQDIKRYSTEIEALVLKSLDKNPAEGQRTSQDSGNRAEGGFSSTMEEDDENLPF